MQIELMKFSDLQRPRLDLETAITKYETITLKSEQQRVLCPRKVVITGVGER